MDFPRFYFVGIFFNMDSVPVQCVEILKIDQKKQEMKLWIFLADQDQDQARGYYWTFGLVFPL